jgi:hypothetical protein
MKERLGMTQLRTQANQMKFGEVSLFIRDFHFFIEIYFKIEEDAYQDAIGYSTGLIGKSGSGKVRAAQVDSKTKAKISQKLQVCFFLFLLFNNHLFFFRKLYNVKIIHLVVQQQFIIENKLVEQHQVSLLLHFK